MNHGAFAWGEFHFVTRIAEKGRRTSLEHRRRFRPGARLTNITPRGLTPIVVFVAEIAQSSVLVGSARVLPRRPWHLVPARARGAVHRYRFFVLILARIIARKILVDRRIQRDPLELTGANTLLVVLVAQRARGIIGTAGLVFFGVSVGEDNLFGVSWAPIMPNRRSSRFVL